MDVAKSYLAIVGIGLDQPLDETATLINQAIDGFTLKKDTSGRFEEVSAYIDRRARIDVQLFGIPDGESSDHYVLEFRAPVKIVPAVIGAELHSNFISNLPSNGQVLDSGYLNASQHVAKYLSSSTGLRCWALIA